MPIRDIPLQRLCAQRLSGPKFETPTEVVAWLGAAQAQDYAGAKWGVALRAQGLTDAALDRAMASGAILRTHVLRPTWHFVAPADIRWLLALTAPRVHALNAHYYRRLELDGAVFKRSHATLAKALQGGRQLTRAEVAEALERAGAVAAGQRLAYILMHAELEGLICSGGLRGRQHTYALLDERVPQAQPLERPEALRALAGRYFTSHGPATLKDFAGWASLTLADAQAGLEAVRPRLHAESAGGRTYWFAPAAAAAPARAAAGRDAHLLSIYDEYLIGYKDFSPVFDAARFGKEGAPSDLLFAHNSVIVLQGQVAGTWKRTFKGGAALAALHPFRALRPAERRALRARVEQYGAFLGRPVTLVEQE